MGGPGAQSLILQGQWVLENGLINPRHRKLEGSSQPWLPVSSPGCLLGRELGRLAGRSLL